MLMTNFETNL